MANMLDAAIAHASSVMLTHAGSDWTYRRGQQTDTVTLNKSDQQPVVTDNGSGLITEVITASFRGVASDLSDFGEPKRGDKITDGTLTYEVRPIVDKCFYTVGSLIHIHAQRVAS